MESLESRCLFNVGPGVAAEYYVAPPQGAYDSFRGDSFRGDSFRGDSFRGDSEAENLGRFRDDGRPADFGAVQDLQYGFESQGEAQRQAPQGPGTLGLEPQGFGTQDYETTEVFFVVQPVFFANFVVIDFETPDGTAAERSDPAPAAHGSQPAAISTPSSTADESTAQGAAKAFAFVSSANAQFTYAADPIDGDSAAVKAAANLTQRADPPARSDAIDAGRPVLSWLASRPQPLVSLGIEDGRHSATPPIQLQLNDSNHVGADVQGKRPTEAPTNLDHESTLMRPIAQIGGSAGVQDAVDSILGGIRTPFEGQPQAAVAIRSAASFASGVQLHLWQASAAAIDAQLPWASLAPMLPHVSPEAVQLGQALDAVLADLDELGAGIVSSLTDGDRLAWWLGAGGVVYYVASRHFQRRATGAASASQRARRSVATAPRRIGLAVRPLFD